MCCNPPPAILSLQLRMLTYPEFEKELRQTIDAIEKLKIIKPEISKKITVDQLIEESKELKKRIIYERMSFK